MKIDPEIGISEARPGETSRAATTRHRFGRDHETEAPFLDHVGKDGCGIAVLSGRTLPLDLGDARSKLYLMEGGRFAADSLLEGRGFEPPVPLANESSLRRSERCRESEKASLGSVS